jgi:hypothetical protein
MANTSCKDTYESIVNMPSWEKLRTTAAAELEQQITACYKGGQITLAQFEKAMTALREHNETARPADDAKAEFVFTVSSVRLTPAQKSKIATAIQGAVLTELAQLDLGAQQSGPDYLLRPATWYGGRIIGLADLNLEAAGADTRA